MGIAARLLMVVIALGATALVYKQTLRHQQNLLEAIREAEEGPPSSDLGEEPSPPASSERRSGGDARQSGGPKRSYYAYVDEGGSLRYVDALERVPKAFREKARKITTGGQEAGAGDPVVNRADAPPVSPLRRRYKVTAAAAAERAKRASDGVVVYTTSWCPWCRKTLAWLDERGVDYENRDIEADPEWREELIEKTGRSSIPVVEIDGELVHGFDPKRLSELL
jgi:glutaredoxin-like YruB-family protein